MKSFLLGTVAGSAIGVIAASVLWPCIAPDMKKALRKGKRLMKCKLNKML